MESAIALPGDFWQLVGLLTAFFTACAGAGKLLLSQTQRHLDERFMAVSARLDGIETGNREEAAQWQRLERELMTMKADLPVQYVRREDYIRGQSIIEAKLDALAAKLETQQLRAMSRPGEPHV